MAFCQAFATAHVLRVGTILVVRGGGVEFGIAFRCICVHMSASYYAGAVVAMIVKHIFVYAYITTVF